MPSGALMNDRAHRAAPNRNLLVDGSDLPVLLAMGLRGLLDRPSGVMMMELERVADIAS